MAFARLAADPRRPQAFPARRPTDLMGRIRVRLAAEDHELVAYGLLFTLALPPLIWALVLRMRRRHARVVDDFAAVGS